MSEPTPQVHPAGIVPESSRTGITDAPTPDAWPPLRALRVTRLRLWPALVLIAVQWAAMTVPGWIPQVQGTRVQINAMLFGAMGGSICVALWWLFASRAPWVDRVLMLGTFLTSGLAASLLAHPTFMYRLYGPIVRGLPMVSTVWVLWLLLTPRLQWSLRRWGSVAAIILAWGYCDLVRLDGVYGDFSAQTAWRWTETDEDRFMAELAQRKSAPKSVSDVKVAELRPGDWPGFRGPNRDSKLTGVRLATDWKQNPPEKLWSQRIGPGWSSFAVVGDRIYTQEQRDKDEVVVCYDANTGAGLWTHTDPIRFYEEVAGPGPRATPTFADGKLYALGAKGKLNCLDPVTGEVKWSRDIAADSGAKVPMWGFSSSPLVTQGIVTVFAGGPGGKSVLGYHASSGELAWSAGDGTDGYSSPQLEHLCGVDQIVVASDKGLEAFEPAGGKILWKHDWQTEGAPTPRVAQPAPVGDSDVLIGTQGHGARRIHLTHADDSWSEQLVWESKAIKPYYNDLVIYKDHLYGFDGIFFTCVGLEDGKTKWRTRGYGNGQVILLADQGLLLISTEKGEVALVEATPERHKEVAKFKAIEGKTWNHPVVAHGKLFIRNGDEVACFQLREAAGKDTSGK
jgi:outer membrane protein assembly factor BamB